MKPTIEAELKPVPPQRVAYLTAPAGGWGNTFIGPVIGPLFDRLADALVRAEIGDFGPGIAIYEAEDSGDETTVRVTAAFAVGDDVRPGEDFAVQTLPAIELAAVTAHHGVVATIDQSWHSLMDWTRAEGYELSGVCREVYLTPGYEPQETWVTELQQPVQRLAS